MKNRHGIRVLIVDDDQSSLNMLEEFLQEEGFGVVTASDGAEAIKKIREKDLDIILTDLKMPGVDGIEVLKTAKKVDANLHVVIVTGYASLETALQAIKEGAYDYITKPFRLEEVLVVLKNVSEKVELERDKRGLVADLKEAYEELKVLKQSKMDLGRNICEIDKKMEEDQDRIEKNLETLHTLPGDLLPFHYTEMKGKDYDKTLSELERLGKLREEGILTEDEFKVCKERLLRRI